MSPASLPSLVLSSFELSTDGSRSVYKLVQYPSLWFVLAV